SRAHFILEIGERVLTVHEFKMAILARVDAVRVIAVACVLALPFLPLGADTVRAEPSDTVRVRVLTLNLYGLRHPSKHGSTPDKSDCAGRLKAAAQRIRSADPPYDIVGIQELYSLPESDTIACDPAPFLDELGAAGSPGFQKIVFSPKGRTSEGEANGGIALITPHIIEQQESRRFVGAGARLHVARGAVFARVAIRSGLKVDVYVAHLSPGHQRAEERKRELAA